PELEALARRTYQHLLLCADDFPFVQDGTRRDAGFRTKGQKWYLEKLATSCHHLVHGCQQSRIAGSRAVIGA
ncbi:MAG: ATPase, partial [Verrucomicrobiota bacterium]